MQYVIGVDIGGTKCAVILGKQIQGQMPQVMQKIVFETAKHSAPEDAIEKMYECVDSLLAQNNLERAQVAAIGISCGSPLDSKRGLILSPPNLIGWDAVPIAAMFQDHFGIPTKLQNDANAGALAEWLYGAAQGTQNAIFITFGTGCGAGLILDGRLYSGTSDMAGECGHLRLAEFGPVGYGKGGSMEGFCSGGGIAQLAQTMAREHLQEGKTVAFCQSVAQLDGITTKLVAQHAKNADALALKVFQVAGEQLGKGLSILIDLLNPEVIVIGSIFVRCHAFIYPHAQAVIERECLTHTKNVCRVVPAMLDESIGDIAALAVAQHHIQP